MLILLNETRNSKILGKISLQNGSCLNHKYFSNTQIKENKLDKIKVIQLALEKDKHISCFSEHKFDMIRERSSIIIIDFSSEIVLVSDRNFGKHGRAEKYCRTYLQLR